VPARPAAVEPADAAALAAVAASVVEEAGRLVLDALASARTHVSTKSTGTDMVTEVDRASEALIGRLLAERRPGDGLVAEEGTDVATSTGVVWVADPLDGTTNFLYGFPSFDVSLAAQVEGATVAAAVRDPLHGETFRASLGGGSWCDDRRLVVGGPPTLATALVGTGFSYDPAQRAAQGELVARVLPRVRDIRRAGAAALDLCWVGLGRLDAFYERGLALWDWAGGSLVAAEAGARCELLDDGTYVAAPPHLFDALVELLGAAG
jgi:myo-inositol-1(or 4)-monophosphatase